MQHTSKQQNNKLLGASYFMPKELFFRKILIISYLGTQ